MGVVALNLRANTELCLTGRDLITLSCTHLSLFAPGAGSYVKLDRGSSHIEKDMHCQNGTCIA